MSGGIEGLRYGAVVRRLARHIGRALNVDPGLVEVDGLVFHGTRDHRRHLWAIAVGRDEPLTIRRFMTELAAGDVVFDVGAYLGSFALRAGRAVGTNGHVVAFEPDPSTSAALWRSVEANGLTDRVELVQAAVSEQSGEVDLHRHPVDPSQTSIVSGRQGESIRVRAVRLDELSTAPDVLKIDAEGADLAVLRSLGERLRGVRTVFVEYGSAMASSERDALVSHLISAGLDRIDVINDRGGTVHPWPLSADDHSVNYVNLCATRA